MEVLREPSKKLTIAKGMEFNSSSQAEIFEKRDEHEKSTQFSQKNNGLIISQRQMPAKLEPHRKK